MRLPAENLDNMHDLLRFRVAKALCVLKARRRRRLRRMLKDVDAHASEGTSVKRALDGRMDAL